MVSIHLVGRSQCIFLTLKITGLGKKKVYENYLCVSRVSMHVGVDKASFCDL